MIGEVDFHGVLVTPLLVWLVIAFALSLPLRKILEWTNVYRFVWHRALFDAALLVILTALVSAGANSWSIH